MNLFTDQWLRWFWGERFVAVISWPCVGRWFGSSRALAQLITRISHPKNYFYCIIIAHSTAAALEADRTDLSVGEYSSPSKYYDDDDDVPVRYEFVHFILDWSFIYWDDISEVIIKQAINEHCNWFGWQCLADKCSQLNKFALWVKRGWTY